ncbi:MAG: SURF1 family protein [Actinomycetota bacterium]|nr:SURF1 family protein [Actinomycetota bacterium]
MLSLLRTPRWLGFTGLVIVVIVAFGLLSLWQWHRAEEKRADRIEFQAALASTVIPLTDLELGAGVLADADVWRQVSATGEYVAGTEVLARKRPLDARNGFWALAALRQADGRVLWVNRGWLPATGDALSSPVVPAPPSGRVEVIGYVRAFEEAAAGANDGLPGGQIGAVAPSALPSTGPAYPGYLQLAESTPPEEELIAVPLPTVDEGRNISYAIQWLIFAAVALGGWFLFLRREAREDAMAESVTPG